MKTFIVLSLALFALCSAHGLWAQTGQLLTASADKPGVQQHFLFNSRPANFFIYDYTATPNATIDYITLQHEDHHEHDHTLVGTMKVYSYALAPNITPANDAQIITQYANMIRTQGGSVYEENATGARMEINQNGVGYYILLTPAGGGTQFNVIVFEYNPNEQ